MNPELERKVGEWERMFWLTRIPSKTKQAKEVSDWLRTALTEAYELGRKECAEEEGN